MILVPSLVLSKAQFMMVYQINHLFTELHSVVLELKYQNSIFDGVVYLNLGLQTAEGHTYNLEYEPLFVSSQISRNIWRYCTFVPPPPFFIDDSGAEFHAD